MNVWEIIIVCFSFQALFIALLLFFKNSPVRQANFIWAIFLLLFSLNMFYNVIYWSNTMGDLSYRLAFFFLIPFSLYGPLFYLYIRTLITDKKFDVRDIVHFLPCTLVLIGFGPYYILPSDLKVEILYANRLSEFTLIPKWYFYWGLSIILMAYAIGTYLKFKKFFSKDKELNLWLKLISVLNFLFSISWASYFVLVKTNVLKIEYDYFLTVMMIIFIGMTTYFGFNYQVIFNGKSLKKVFPLIKYEKSGLSEKVSLDLKEKLIHLIKIEALYLNSELKLIDVANLLNISRHHASQLINEYFEMSFYELLNKYRIEEAERLLIDQNSTGLNITDIAFKSGFNNRMSFYNSFKKHFGTTPSEFRNQNLAS